MISPFDHPAYRDERYSAEEIEAAETLWREALEHADDAGPRAITHETLASGLLGPGGEAKLKEREKDKKREWLPLWKPSEFLNFTPPQDFVLMGDCHLTRGNLTVISGWPGVGKSRAAMALAIAGASGADWLGHAVHSRFRTLLIQCENGPFRLKSELGEATPGDDDEVLDKWLRITPPPPYGLAFSEPSFRAELRRHIAEFQPGLVIIDPWNRAADGDKQQDYRQALDSIFACLPEDPAQRPALLVIHHMRKKGSEASGRKHGRDLLHELAGSYQIGAAARCVFALEPGSKDLSDGTVVLTCCKNNDGKEGAPSAWHRRNGLFDPCLEFDMEGFLSGGETEASQGLGSRVDFQAMAKALRGTAAESRKQVVERLVRANVCSRSTAYNILDQFPDHLVEDGSGKYWWREDV